MSKLKVPDPLSPLLMPITIWTLLSSMQEVSLLADRKQMVQAVLSDKSYPHFPNKQAQNLSSELLGNGELVSKQGLG